MALYTSALILAVVGTALAGPLGVKLDASTSDQCATTCPETSKFNYRVGTTYEYNYASEATTHIPGATEERSTVKMSAKVKLAVISKCEMTLQLADVQLRDVDPAKPTSSRLVVGTDFEKVLEQGALRFAFQDGRVEHVCPNEDEATWALNIKRAILSGLQNTMADLGVHTRNRETDISGECDVDYGISGNKITKVKNLLSCSGHAHYDTLFQSTSFNVPSQIQSLPIIRGTHECEQQLSSGVLSSATCRESHVFKPFSSETSGATTDVTYSLTFSRQRSGGTTSSSDVTRRESLVYEYEPEEEDESSQQDTMQNLRTLCRQTNTNIDTEAPATFMDLVRSMRKLSPPRLAAIHKNLQKAPPCANAEQLFHAAIPSLGTTAGAHLIRTLIMAGKLDERESDLWLTSMAFIARPTRQLLRDVKRLLTQEVSHRKATLAVTSLVHNYCRVKPDCGQVPEIRDIARILTNSLGYSCETTDNHHKVLSALKGIGNAGYRDGSMDGVLNRCILSDTNPMEIRVAAVNAFRRMPCNADRSTLLTVYETSRHDSELRISAYLGVMACPTEDLITRVRTQLQTEDVNQVGSFVWTHLTNLQETTSPLKQHIRRIVEDKQLRRAFDVDKRKFSRNIEWSAFSEVANVGGTLESNLIWSPKSFLPRSANLNLTVDMFGESVNLLEIGGRAEGLDYLLETIFGPNGEPNKKQSDNSINALHNEFKFEKEDKPKGSYFIRLFGNEIRFDDFHNFNVESITSKLNYLDWLLDLSKEHNIDLTRAGLFFDVAMVVPTVAGFPLRLRTDGTAVVKMKATGKFDIRNMLASPRSMHIEGTLEPSAAIQINAAMNVIAYKTKTGLRMTNTLRTNTKADGKVELKDGAIFNVDVNMPDNRMEIFEAKTKFFIEYRDRPREQSMISEGRIEKRGCLGPTFQKIFGVELCGQVAFPRVLAKANAPPFPLTGPASASIVMTKAELGKGFHFETKFIKEQVAGSTGVKNIGRISFSTPGSKIDREFTFEYEVDKPGKTVDIKLKTPFKNLEFNGALVYEDNLKRLTANGKVDSDNYGVKLEVVRVQTRFNTQFKPLVEVSLPRRQPYRLQGRVLYREGKKAELDLRLLNVLDDTLAIEGSIEKKGTTHSLDVELDSSTFKGKISGALDAPKNKPVTSRLTVSYKKGTARFERISLSNEWQYSLGLKYELMLKSALTSSQWPQHNSDISYEMSSEKGTMSTSLDTGLTGTTKRAKFSATGNTNIKRNIKMAGATVTLQVPFKNWDVQYKTNFKQTENEVSASATGRHSPSKEGKIDFTIRREATDAFKTLAELNVRWPGRRMLFRDTINEKRPGEYHHELILEPQPDLKAEVSSVYKRQPRHEFTADITASRMKPIKVSAHLSPEISAFQAGASVQYGADMYEADGEWKYSTPRGGYNNEGSIQIKNPFWNFSTSSKTSKLKKEFSTEAEVILAIRNKAPYKSSFKADATLNPSLPRFSAKADWSPNNFVEITVSGKHDQKTWYHNERDLSGEFHLTSSFEQAKNIQGSFTHRRTPRQMATHTETSWAPGKKVVSDFKLLKRNGWADVAITWETKTPFTDFSLGKMDVSYHLRGSTFESKIRLDKNAHFVQVEVTGAADLPRLNGLIKLTTSIPDYNEMSLTGEVSGSRQIIKGDILGVWWDGKRVGAQFTMNHEETGEMVNTNGRLTVTLPLAKYQTNTFSWGTEKTRSGINTHADLQVGSDKTEFVFAASREKTEDEITLSFLTSLTSPYEPVRALKLSYKQMYDRTTYKDIRTEGLVQWAPSKILTLNTHVEVQDKLITKDTRITTPFSGYETIHIFNEYTPLRHGFKTHKEIKWGLNKRVVLDTSYSWTSSEQRVESRLTSSFENMDRIFFELGRKLENDMWHVTGRLDYPGNKIVEFTAKYRWDDIKRVILEFKSPCPYLEQVSFDAQHSGSPRNFDTKVEFEHKLMSSKATLVVDIDVRDLDKVNTKLEIKSPFKYMRFLKVSTSHEKKGSEYATIGLIEYPSFKTKLENKLILNRWNRFEEEMKFTGGYKQSQLLVEAGLQVVTTSVDGKLRVTTPFEGYQLSTLTIKHTGPWHDFNNAGTLLINGRKFVAAGEFMYDPADIKVKGNLRMPYPEYSPVHLEFSHTGQPTDMNQEFKLSVAGSNIYSRHQFKLDGSKLNQGFLITSPYPRLSSLQIQLGHEGYWRSFKNNGMLEYNGHKYEAKSDYKVLRKGRKGGVSFSIPETYSVSFITKNNSNKKKKEATANIVAKLNGKNVNANTKFMKEGDVIEVEQTLRSSYSKLRTMRASLTHRGPAKNFRNDVQLKWNNYEYNGASQFSLVTNNAGSVQLHANATVQLPDVYSVAINHNGPRYNFNNDLTIYAKGRQIVANSALSFDQKTALEVSGRVSTPFSGYEVFDAVLSHDGDMKSFTSKGTLLLPFQKVKKILYDVSHSCSQNAFNTRTKLGYNQKEALFEVDHRRSKNDFTASGVVEYEGKKVQSDVRWQRRSERSAQIHSGSINFQTPFKYMEKFESKMQQTISGNSYAGQIESTYRNTKYFDVEYAFTNENKKSFVFELREPHEASVKANYERTPSSIDADVDLVWDGADPKSKIRVLLSGQEVRRKYDVEFKVVQPGRTSFVKTNWLRGPSSFNHGAIVQWGNPADSKATYQIVFSRQGTSFKLDVDAATPYKDVEVMVEHECSPRKMKTVVHIQDLKIIHDYLLQGNKFQTSLTAKHPRLSKDVKFTIEGQMDYERPLFDGKVTAIFANNVVSFTGKLGDQSRAGRKAYVANMHLTNPAAYVDLQFESEAGETDEELFLNMNINHKAAVDRRMRRAFLRSTFNKNDKHLRINSETPFGSASLSGGKVTTYDPAIYSWKTDATFGSRQIKAQFDLDTDKPSAELEVQYKPGHELHVSAQYVSKSTIQFEAYRQTPTERITDSLLAFRLNNSRLFHARAFMRPQIFNAAEMCGGLMISCDAKQELDNLYNQVSSAMAAELSNRAEYMRQAAQPLVDFREYVDNDMKGTWRLVMNAYKKAYRNNDFYTKTISTYLKENGNNAKAYLQRKWEEYEPTMRRRQNAIQKSMESLQRSVSNKVVRWSRDTADDMSTFFSGSLEAAQSFKEGFNDFMNAPWFTYLDRKYNEIAERVSMCLKDMIDRVRRNPRIQSAISKVTALRESQYFQPLRTYHAQVSAHMETLRAKSNAMTEKARKEVADLFDTPEMRELQTFIQQRISQGREVYKFYGFADAERWVQQLRASGLDELKTKTLKKILAYLQPSRTRITSWNPTIGDFQVEIYLPAPVRNLRDLPLDELRRLKVKVRHALNRVLPDDGWIPWDTLYAYRVSSNPRDWIPPFKAHATLAGFHHYLTFDRTFYDYEGECTYLLAHDFADRNFSIMVDYAKKSIKVLSSGKSIEISSDTNGNNDKDFKVTVDGNKQEMPTQFGETSIVRIANRIQVDNTKGVTVTCELPYDRCTVNVTGWYFAKTAGMFGTYDNEPSTDFLMADHNQASSPEQLAHSWTVGPKCRVYNKIRKVETNTESRIYRTCASYFKDQSSQFRPCFRQVETGPFMQMCLNELTSSLNTVEGAKTVCEVASFYVDECKRAGVALRHPTSCVSCRLENGRVFSESEDQTLEGDRVPKSADIVFVVSQKGCNTRAAEMIQKFVTTLETTFKTNGVRHNRYGLVGFGGTGVHAHAHSHTMDTQLFNNKPKFIEALRRLDIAEDSAEAQDTFQALRMAAFYPFRAGVSKMIVLVPCDQCQGMAYPDMQQLLTKRDIKLHILMQHDFRLKSNSPKASNIFGVTRDTVYTGKLKGGKNMEGDVALRKYTLLPKDLCAVLSHDTDGTIFNSKKYINGNIKMQKLFTTMMSGVVAKLGEPAECQVCECLADDSGTGNSVCHNCDEPDSFYGLFPMFNLYGVNEDLPDIPGLPSIPKRPAKTHKTGKRQKKHRRGPK